MTLLENSACIVLSTITVVLAVVLYWCHRRAFSYWRNRGVQYIQPTWFFGSVRDELLGRESWSSFLDKCYKSFKDKGFGGIYMFVEPCLFVCDPQLIERMLVQDSIFFHDRWAVGSHESLAQNLTNETGEKWRIMRYKLGQAFSSKKIKGMFDQIFRSGDYVMSKVEKITKKGEPVNVEPLVLVFVTEALSSCTFGLQLTSDCIQRQRLKEVLTIMHDNPPTRFILFLLGLIYPKLFSFLGIRVISQKMTSFFSNLTRGAIMYRDLNQIKRNDFLQMVLSLKEQEENGSLFNTPDLTEEDQMLNQVRAISYKQKSQKQDQIFTEDCIAALMMNFVQAGLKPSVATVTFALYEIARNQEIQKKLHDEIDRVISKHKTWTYELIRDLTYLDLVIQETLRRWNFNLALFRKVTEHYKIPNTEITLEKGTVVYILMSCVHMDPQYFPDPEEFIPERFSDSSFKPTSTFMPFGQGPRICIGIRLAVTMMKVCIARILSEYQLEVSDRMASPLVLDPTVYYPKVVGGTWISFRKRMYADVIFNSTI